jgi:ABC-2 type transport system permease protein
MRAIFKRELRAYFHNVTGFVFLAFMLFAAGGVCAGFNIFLGSSRFEDCLYYLQIALVIAIPLLTMRSFTDERRGHTDQLLYSLPLPLWKIVLGKYLAMVAVFGVSCLIIAVFPLILTMFGMTGLGSAYSALLAFFMLGAALIALCTFLSSMTENSIVAMILSVVGVLVLFLVDTFVTLFAPIGAVASLIVLVALAGLLALAVFGVTKNWCFTGLVGAVLILPQIIVFAINSQLYDGLVYRVVSAIALFYRFSVFCSGIFDLTTIIYDLSVVALFLFLAWQVMEKRRRA